MKEHYSAPSFESETGSGSGNFEQSFKNNALDATGELDPGDPKDTNSDDYSRLLDGLADENTQNETSPVTSLAREIIIQALSGHLESLNRLQDQGIIDTLTTHVEYTLREYKSLEKIPDSLINGMVSIARYALTKLQESSK